MFKDNYDPESDKNGKPPKFFQIRHFLNFLWNTPRWFVNDLYYKYYQKSKDEALQFKIDNELLKMELLFSKKLLNVANESKEELEKKVNK